jgi:hypothetical protein
MAFSMRILSDKWDHTVRRRQLLSSRSTTLPHVTSPRRLTCEQATVAALQKQLDEAKAEVQSLRAQLVRNASMQPSSMAFR